jgi:hypothetical protein
MDGDGFSPACDAILTGGAYACEWICPSIMIVMIGLILGLILGAKCSKMKPVIFRIQTRLSSYK